MSPEADCPICALAAGENAARIVHANGICFAPGRHVGSWPELSTTEHFAILAMISEALQEPAASLRADVAMGHLVLRIDKQVAPAAHPGLLIAGGQDPLLAHLVRQIDRSDEVDLAVAFALDSGVALLFPWLEDLLGRGGALRLVVGDYLDVTEPSALRRLQDLGKEGLAGRFQAYVFETQSSSFHPKAWLFRAAGTDGATIVGSSNLTRTALTEGIEWNLHSSAPQDRRAVQDAFETLLSHPNLRPLTDSWIDGYSNRRQSRPLPEFAASVVADEHALDRPEPHGVQTEALAALDATRQAGYRAGLVVLATGLGKTWLSAFDSRSFERVLFVAHREEILAQAMATFRQIRPEGRFGHFTGTSKEQGDIVFASIQTLGRAEHLNRFDPNDFDYIVVDEFHHAAAASYRGLLDHFTPRFLLGLTATPERTDGGDLLSLCGENLVFRCDLYDGIRRDLLAPFHYFGVPDEVDYAQVPWRSMRFDEEALTTALATQSRANNALEQFRKHGIGPAIGFCASRRHAEFMAEHFRNAGLRAVAVHSGEGSAPRTSSLEALRTGELDILFAVDMFNEGVDVPNIGTVLMLRPTESTVVFLQQLGRGLRRFSDKVLQVIDYIGNHKTFLIKARALLEAGEGDRSLSQKLDAVIAGELSLPPGCEVTYELRALDMLRAMLKQRTGSDEAEAWYRDFRDRMGERPTAAEFYHAGFHPTRTGHGTWFDFVHDMGDLVPDAADVHRSLLQRIERANFVNPGPLYVLEALLPGLSRGLTAKHLRSRTLLRAARSGDQKFDEAQFSSAWSYWESSPDFSVEGDLLALRRREAPGLPEMLAELIAWRSAAVLEEGERASDRGGSGSQAGPELWREYIREDIPPLFGTTFNPGNWNSGIVPLGNALILLTTLKKGSLSAGNHYDDRFLSATRLQWQSQTQTRRDSKHGRILSGHLPNSQVHLFVRSEKLRETKAAPFLYLGIPQFSGWQGDKPITVEWDLGEPIPEHFRKMLGVP